MQSLSYTLLYFAYLNSCTDPAHHFMQLRHVTISVGILQAAMMTAAKQVDEEAALTLLDLFAGKPGPSLPLRGRKTQRREDHYHHAVSHLMQQMKRALTAVPQLSQALQIAEEANANNLLQRMARLLKDSQAPTGDKQLDLARHVVHTHQDYEAAKIQQINHQVAKSNEEKCGLDMHPAQFHPCKNRQDREDYVAAAAKEAQASTLACKSTMMGIMRRA